MHRRLTLSLLALTLVATACGGGTSVFDLGEGDCFNDRADMTEAEAEVESVETVDCSEPHDNEIYYEYSMTETAYPGDNAAADAAMFRCIEEFDAFVGTAYLDSALDTFPITPTTSSWAAGDRVVYCAVYAMDLSRLRGSMRSSGR